MPSKPESGYCYTCGILGAPQYKHDATPCRNQGHEVKTAQERKGVANA